MSVNHIEVYKAYLEAKNDPKKTITQVAKDFGITRRNLYVLVKRIESGDTRKVKECTERSRLECLWKYKYHPLFIAIPSNQKPGSTAALGRLIKEMLKDGFSIRRISSLIKKDRATVLYHSNKK